jgi:hypothetical protein
MESPCMSVNQGMDKENVAFMHTEETFSHKE